MPDDDVPAPPAPEPTPAPASAPPKPMDRPAYTDIKAPADPSIQRPIYPIKKK